MAGLRCEVVRSQLDDLLDERLTPVRAERLSAHLHGCAACAEQWQALRDLRAALRQMPAEPLPEGFGERLHRKLAAAAATPAPRRPRPWGRIALPAGTGVLGFLAAAALAAPLLSSASSAPAEGANACCQAAPTAALRQALQPAGPATMEATPRAGAFAAASFSQNSVTPAGGNGSSAPGSGAVPSGGPDAGAVALTLVATSPPRTVEKLTAAAAQVDGSVSALPGGPAHSSAGGGVEVATMDAVVPAAAAGAFVDTVSRFGTVLARAGTVPAAKASGDTVRVLVTVLAPAAPAPPAAAAAARPQRASSASSLVDEALLRIGQRAWWGAAAVLVWLGTWFSLGWLRRPPLP